MSLWFIFNFFLNLPRIATWLLIGNTVRLPASKEAMTILVNDLFRSSLYLYYTFRIGSVFFRRVVLLLFLFVYIFEYHCGRCWKTTFMWILVHNSMCSAIYYFIGARNFIKRNRGKNLIVIYANVFGNFLFKNNSVNRP